MGKYKRIIVVVMDSVGCGTQPDFMKYHAEKCNTLKSVYNHSKTFCLPNLEKMGLAGILGKPESRGIYGYMQERSAGNDTFAGIWEIFGSPLDERYRTEESGFTNSQIDLIQKTIETEIVGNEYISGFKALDKYYDEHKAKLAPIIYLADDGVLLMAAHEDVIPAEKLNEMGRKLSKCLDSFGISRIITRPFVGQRTQFIRTENRSDFLTKNNLYSNSILPDLRDKGVTLIATEHIWRLFGRPTEVKQIVGNHNNAQLTVELLKSLSEAPSNSVIVTVFQDFDMFGHRHDVDGYADSLIEFDSLLPSITSALNSDDLLIITADHGCDPTLEIRGHTREFVPLIMFSPSLQQSINLGKRNSFADIAMTICENFEINKTLSIGSPIYEVL